MRKLRGLERRPDDLARDVGPTRRLLQTVGLLTDSREYTVVTGSKGKGSTTIITAKLLQHLGHTVGTITSPHLVTWRERIRVNGRAIPEPDFLRILDELAPSIDAIEATLLPTQYFSPQGIFLAMALRWFDEQGVNAAVLEVGRGGRFDDIAVVSNKLALFTPITLEHVHQLGPTLERIAWHKAGIIKPHGYAYSVPQAPEVMQVLSTEAAAVDAQFDWIAPMDMGVFVGLDENGQRVRMGRYGEVTLSLIGRYQIVNATLATIAAGNMHARLDSDIPHISSEYVERIRTGLADVVWPGRVQKLQDNPAVYLDGAIFGEAARSLVETLRDLLTPPVVSIIAVPDDKDYRGVYAQLGSVSQTIILTETARNPGLSFLPPQAAIDAMRPYNANVRYAPNLAEAVDLAKAEAGTIIIAGTQSILSDAITLWGLSYEAI
jgi:dihydrofolate synthase/folylpolyglutamate synthase